MTPPLYPPLMADVVYPPDPTLHSDPEIEKRCPFCHPEIITARAAAAVVEVQSRQLETAAAILRAGLPAWHAPDDGQRLVMEQMERQRDLSTRVSDLQYVPGLRARR